MSAAVLFDVRNLYYLPQFEPVQRALDARGVDSDVRRHTYKVLPQEDED